MTSVYAFVLLQKEEALARSAAKSTECRIRLILDQYDLIYASIDQPEVLKKFEEDFKEDIEGEEGIRNLYEYVMDLDHEHYNTNSDVDEARNALEMKAGSIHRRLLLFARVRNILTQEAVKEYFGKFLGSWNPEEGHKPEGGDISDRRFL